MTSENKRETNKKKAKQICIKKTVLIQDNNKYKIASTGTNNSYTQSHKNAAKTTSALN